MRDGIYIRPAIVRLVAFGAIALLVRGLKREAPSIRRYVKFETM